MTRGEYMRRARKNAGFTLDDLSKASGIYKNTIHLLEKGKSKGTIDTIELLADALGLSVDEYIGHKIVPRKMTENERFFTDKEKANGSRI